MGNFVFISPHFPSSYWKFCLALKNKGWNVLGIGDAPYNEIPDECKFALTEYYCCHDMENYENEKRAVEHFQNKYGKIDFIESNNEFWLERDARLRDDFNVVSGAGVEEAKRFKFKSLQKKFFEEAGIKCARYCVPNSIEDLEKFVKKVGYPIFAKPDNGVGAQGVKKIKNIEDLLGFATDLLNKNALSTYIFEEYVDGDITSFDGICNDESDVVFCTKDVFFEDTAQLVAEELDDGYYCDPYPEKEYVELGKKVVKALGLRKRFFHIEMFVLRSDHKYLGKKGTIIPLEANCRPAGGYTPDLINYSNSVSCYDIYADVITTNTTTVNMNWPKYYAITSSRRRNREYAHTMDDILKTFYGHICMFGEYPEAIRDDMGDFYVFAKFNTLEEALEFDRYAREKK